jgi:hypothetical protein
MTDLHDLPEEIPERLRRLGRPLAYPDEGLFAWDPPTAEAVLESLRGTKVAIFRGAVYDASTEDPAPVDDWYAKPLWGEQATAFAERSRSLAAARLRHHVPCARPVFVFEFAPQDAAA